MFDCSLQLEELKSDRIVLYISFLFLKSTYEIVKCHPKLQKYIENA